MPRPFSPTESELIRERLLAAGRRSFEQRGLRATTVESLARAVGISKGAFYAFFASKEELFLAALAEHERAVHEEVVEAVRADPSHGVEILIGTALAAGRDNPFVRVALSDEGSVLMRSLDDDQQARLQVRDEALVAAVAVALRDAGQELRVPEPVVAGLLRALVMVGWHRDDIGVPVADEVLAWLIPTLRAALLDPAGGRA